MARKIKKYTNPFLKEMKASTAPDSQILIKIQDAIELHQRGLFGQAETLYRELLEVDPKNADVLHLLGVIAYQTGRYKVAVDLISKAIKVNPNQASYYSNRGITLQKLNKLEDAVENYQKAIALDPELIAAYFNNGNALQNLNQFEMAIANYNYSIALKPDYSDAYSNRGNALKKINQLDAAIASYNKAIFLKPDFVDAHYNQGVAFQELRQIEAAIASYKKVISLKPEYVEAHYNLGILFNEIKKLNDALASYDKAISLKPNYAEAYYNRGISLQELKQLEDAVASYDKAIIINPNYAEAYSNRGNALKELNQLEAALASYEKSINLKSDFAEAFYNKGVIFQELNRLDDAVTSYTNAILIKPNYAEAYLNRGNVFLEMKQLDASIIDYEKSIALSPILIEAYYNLGNTLQELKQFDAAVVNYDKAIELSPTLADAYYNKGNALQNINLFDAAIACYDKAVSLKPSYAEAYCNRGNALKNLKCLDAAIESYEIAIFINPDFENAYYNLGISLHELKQFDAAIVSFNKAASLKHDFDYLFGLLLNSKMYICDWKDFHTNLIGLTCKIQNKLKASTCFPVLALPIGLTEQRQVAETWSKDVHPFNPSLGLIPKSSRQSKIRIGYFSADYHNHATTYLMAELFELHDKAKFETIAFSYGPDTRDEMRNRVAQAFDKFIDVKAMSDKSVAQLSRELGVDIAVDLKGFTQDARLGIFSYKAAPIQVSYLGYPGTLGTDYIDYLIADKILIPQASQQYYAEKIVYLPNSYQINDRKKIIAQVNFTKQELGLPIDAFVFCCFNNSYKITPLIFDSWARILKAVDNSVLWLLEDNSTLAVNLRKEAALRGLDPKRLVFAKRMSLPEHLARQKAANLFLDTQPYNAHTTASDALWVGLPVLTCMGESFASRVASSLLYAIGLPELVTETRLEYELLAIELGTNPRKLLAIQNKLKTNKLTTSLFDSKLLTKHIESAYIKMYEQHQENLPPNHIYIDEVLTL
jgi:protein O-GlcNAc transferase